MKFTRYTAALILWYYFAKMESEKNGWGIYLDYALLGSLILLILGIGIEIWRAVKDRKDSQNEHTGIKDNENKNKEFLAQDHNRLSSELNAKCELLKFGQENISQSTSEIRETVSSIDKQLAVEQTKHDDLMRSMTIEQSNVHSQINAIYALNQQLPALQFEKQQLSQQYEELLQKHNALQHDYNLLVKQNEQLQQEANEFQEGFEQSLE